MGLFCYNEAMSEKPSPEEFSQEKPDLSAERELPAKARLYPETLELFEKYEKRKESYSNSYVSFKGNVEELNWPNLSINKAMFESITLLTTDSNAGKINSHDYIAIGMKLMDKDFKPRNLIGDEKEATKESIGWYILMLGKEFPPTLIHENYINIGRSDRDLREVVNKENKHLLNDEESREFLSFLKIPRDSNYLR